MVEASRRPCVARRCCLTHGWYYCRCHEPHKAVGHSRATQFHTNNSGRHSLGRVMHGKLSARQHAGCFSARLPCGAMSCRESRVFGSENWNRYVRRDKRRKYRFDDTLLVQAVREEGRTRSGALAHKRLARLLPPLEARHRYWVNHPPVANERSPYKSARVVLAF